MTMSNTVVLAWHAVPSTSSLLEALSKSSRRPGASVHDVRTASEDVLRELLAADGMVVCVGTIAPYAHLLAPRQRAFFDATEDSFLFRTLLGPRYPDFAFRKTATPWSADLDWSDGRRYVVKPNIGYSSADTFVVNNRAEQRALEAEIATSREFVIEEFIAGTFLCADVVFEDGVVLVTSVYQRYDYGIKETAQFHSSSLYKAHAARFVQFVKQVVFPCLPVPPNTRTMINIEAKLGDDGILRCVEINPFRACGVAPLASSLIFGRNVFELAFAEDLGNAEFDAAGRDTEVVFCFARNEGETALDLLAPVLKALRKQDGRERDAAEVRAIWKGEEDRAAFGIHDARMFRLTASRSCIKKGRKMQRAFANKAQIGSVNV